MRVEGKVVVVTGAASGIGRAMARRFASEGAATVVVADLDGERAAVVAGEIAERRPALGVRCDVTDEEDVAALLDRAEREAGPVEVFCANAGLAAGTGPETPDEQWTLSWQVHVMAHVYAARHLLPRWLERGGGYFLATASAAGLLTQIGSAPYAVTKHATVAFAEWLAVTYGDRGIRVSCLCPMGVRTPLLEGGERGLGAIAVASVTASGDVLEPEQVAEAVVTALGEERFLVLPHPEVQTFLRRKAEDPDRWLAGMRRLQAGIVGD
jgi:NAD(P)-dependent dehydrogenase (short-subunit alcohol dehydrogenase family)